MGTTKNETDASSYMKMPETLVALDSEISISFKVGMFYVFGASVIVALS
jgi:hypothetical protein